MNRRILPYGDSALLVELDDLAAVLALYRGLAASRPDGVVDLVPAARTIAVVVDPRILSLSAAAGWLERARPLAADAAEERLVELEVHYDGDDLAEVARLTGRTEAEVVAAHTGTVWRVAFGGFAPGFAYLVGDGDTPGIPRRATPRTAVPAGAVGLAGAFSGVYPRSSPGGWQLIGRTDAVLWDETADPPALLLPGTVVRFREGGMTGLRILDPGPLSLVQDLGRPGLAALGVGRSGALDRGALRLGNRLLGNAEGAAGVEALLGGLTARFEEDAWFAVTGAVGASTALTLDDRPVDAHLAVRARAGQTLRLGQPTSGMRWYLTVRGGIAVPPVLGSRSRDTLAGLGPAPLRAGDVLPLGAHPGTDLPLVDFVPVADPVAGAVEVRAHRGPRADWFTDTALDSFFSAEWRAAAESDRVGVRLDPPHPTRRGSHAPEPASAAPLLTRAVDGELPSEPMVAGAVQVSPDGRPTVLLADHPVTGGYPVIAVVADASLDLFAQLRPGQAVTFRHA